jgi:uncharacterized protein
VASATLRPSPPETKFGYYVADGQVEDLTDNKVETNAKQVVSELFRKWEAGESSRFFAAVADDVVWTAIGSTPISGVSHSKAEYVTKTYLPLQTVFAGSTSCKLKRIVAEDDIVVVEWHGETPLAKGGIYANDYCWVIRVSGEKLAEVTGYFDTAVVNTLFT